MTFTSAQSKSLASARKRDNKGHFIKKDQIKSDFKVSTPAEVKLNPEFEKPIVSVAVSNPFKKILYWLDQIRKHQTTTLAFKLSIPLIVIPVIIAAAFSVGRVSGLGLLANTNQSQSIATAAPVLPVSLSKAGILKVAKSATTTSYLLSLKNGDIMMLEVPTIIDLSKYANKQILVTGPYNKTTNTLRVTDIAEITLFNATVIPEATSSAK